MHEERGERERKSQPPPSHGSRDEKVMLWRTMFPVCDGKLFAVFLIPFLFLYQFFFCCFSTWNENVIRINGMRERKVFCVTFVRSSVYCMDDRWKYEIDLMDAIRSTYTSKLVLHGRWQRRHTRSTEWRKTEAIFSCRVKRNFCCCCQWVAVRSPFPSMTKASEFSNYKLASEYLPRVSPPLLLLVCHYEYRLTAGCIIWLSIPSNVSLCSCVRGGARSNKNMHVMFVLCALYGYCNKKINNVTSWLFVFTQWSFPHAAAHHASTQRPQDECSHDLYQNRNCHDTTVRCMHKSWWRVFLRFVFFNQRKH